MSENKQKNVQAAEAPQPSSKTETAAAAQPKPASQPSSGNAPSIVDIAKALSEDKVKTAEELGVPVTGLLQWAYGVESTLKAIVQNLPEIVQKNTVAAIENYQQQRQAQVQPSDKPSGGASGMVKEILKEVMGSGGVADPTTQWLADIGREQLVMSKVLYTEMLKRMVPDAMQKMAEEMAKAKGTPSG